MLPIQTITGVAIIYIITAASGHRNCDDCIKIDTCTPALQQLHNKSPENSVLLREAYCGFDGLPKVCCSDFVLNRLNTGKAAINNIIKNISTEDDIENHPNIDLLSGECGDLEGNRIMGGITASMFEFPWLVLIAYKVEKSLQFKCGGSVINSRYVLTAAHCIKNKKIYGVRIGEYDISSTIDCIGEGENRECESKIQDIAVSQTIYHHEFALSPQVVNDIGLLRLARPVDFSFRNAGMICLPITKHLLKMDITGQEGIVAGWGRSEKEKKSNILLKVEVPIFSAITCTALYNRNLLVKIAQLENVFCAGEPGHDSCDGDSGGPLMVEAEYNNTYKLVQYGVVSYGSTTCGADYPGIYTDVRKYMKWILDTIKP